MNSASQSDPIVVRARPRTSSRGDAPERGDIGRAERFETGDLNAAIGEERDQLVVHGVVVRRDDGDALRAIVLERADHRTRGCDDRQSRRLRQHG